MALFVAGVLLLALAACSPGSQETKPTQEPIRHGEYVSSGPSFEATEVGDRLWGKGEYINDHGSDVAWLRPKVIPDDPQSPGQAFVGRDGYLHVMVSGSWDVTSTPSDDRAVRIARTYLRKLAPLPKDARTPEVSTYPESYRLGRPRIVTRGRKLECLPMPDGDRIVVEVVSQVVSQVRWRWSPVKRVRSVTFLSEPDMKHIVSKLDEDFDVSVEKLRRAEPKRAYWATSEGARRRYRPVWSVEPTPGVWIHFDAKTGETITLSKEDVFARFKPAQHGSVETSATSVRRFGPNWAVTLALKFGDQTSEGRYDIDMHSGKVVASAMPSF